MTELQEKLLFLLKALDDVCEEQKLCYCLLGGTMLGAVREKGFIPWDDDADVGVLRNDYEKLCRLPDHAFPEGVRLRHFSKEAGVPYAFARLEDINTTLAEKRRSGTDYIGGVYIDIFPLDEDTADEKQKRKKEKEVVWLKKQLYAHIAEKDKKKNPMKQMGMWFFKTVTSQEKLVRKLDRVIRENGTECYSNYLGHWGKKESQKKSVFFGITGAERKRYPFEDLFLYGAVDAETYLSGLYGEDYMTPKKEPGQGGHPALLLDLTKPYQIYQMENGRNKNDVNRGKSKT